jgi:mannose/cellobiose epimerase-like protein (N-acyl-D-glucosamine 2-epimerase family)
MVWLLEALTAYLELTGEPLARARLNEMTGILVGCLSRDPISHFAPAYRRDWAPLDRPTARRVSYGHDLKAIMFWMHSLRQRGYNDSPVHDHYFGIAIAALHFAVDPVFGGVLSAGPVGLPADQRLKHAWVQAEGLFAVVELYRISGDDTHRDALLRTLNWIVLWQGDWVRGEWFTTIDEPGRSS